MFLSFRTIFLFILLISTSVSLTLAQNVTVSKEKPDTKKEILFAGYDNIPFLKYLDHPPFASVDMLPFQQGEKAAELLIELMNKRDNQAPVQNLKVAAQIVYY